MLVNVLSHELSNYKRRTDVGVNFVQAIEVPDVKVQRVLLSRFILHGTVL